MGYRSQVIIGVKTDTPVAAKLRDILQSDSLELELYDRRYHVNGYMLVEWDSTKWYDEFEDVEAINKLIMSDESGETFMVCLGEENDLYNEHGPWRNFVSSGGLSVYIDGIEFR